MQIKKQSFVPIIVLLSLIIIFLGRPILGIKNYYYSSANISQFFPLTKSGFEPTNVLTSDIFQQIHPWLLFNKESLQSFEFPLWNPYNAMGVPHLAMYQSSAFSLYHIPFYVFNFQVALIISAFLKLFFCAIFTYLFLKDFNLKTLSCLVAATAYTFSGYNTLSLQWMTTGVTPSLPAALYFITNLTKSKFKLINGAGLMLSLAFGLLAGHPESFYAMLLLLMVYSLHRLLSNYRSWHELSNYRDLLKRSGLIISFSVLGASVSAFQLLPFFEYAWVSGGLSERVVSDSFAARSWLHLPLIVYPDLLGNAATPPYFFTDLTINGSTNSSTFMPGSLVHGIYVGGIVVFLSIFSLKKLKDNKEVRFWIISSICYIIYAYRPINISWFIDLIPGLPHIFSGRADMVFVFCIACLSGYGLDSLIANHSKTIRPAIIVSILGLGMLFSVSFASWQLLITYFGNPPNTIWNEAWNTIGLSRQLWIFFSLIIGGITILGLMILRPRTHQIILSSILILSVFYQTGFYFRNYFPLTHKSSFYPLTPAIQKLKTLIGDQYFSFICSKSDPLPGLPPDSNITYKIHMPTHYESLHTKYFSFFLEYFLDIQNPPFFWNVDCFYQFNRKALQIMGVRAVLVPKSYKLDLLLNDEILSDSILDTHLFVRLQDSLSKYQIIPQAKEVNDVESIFIQLSDPNFDPKKTVIISNDINRLIIDQTHEIEESQPALKDDLSKLQVRKEKNQEILLEVSTERNNSWLLLNIAYYPGWKAYIDNQEVPVYRANYAFHAIQIPTGDHEIIFRYEPLSFKVGIIVSLISLILLIFIGIWIQRKHRI